MEMRREKFLLNLGLILKIAVLATSVLGVVILVDAIKCERSLVDLYEKTDNLHDRLVDTVAYQQSYLISKDEEDLKHFEAGLISIKNSQDELKEKVARDFPKEYESKLNEINTLVDRKIEFMNATIYGIKLKQDIKTIQISERFTLFKINNLLNDITKKSKFNSELQSRNALLSSYVLLFLLVIGTGISLYLILKYLKSVNTIVENEIEEKKMLNAAKEEALKASNLKSKFLATVSHEIRTPLNGIIGLSDVLRKGSNDKEQVIALDTIYESGNNLLKIINDILDFSKIETGNVALENTYFDLNKLVEQIFNLLKKKAHDKNIELKYYVDPHLPQEIYADPSRLSQILFNLIGNAIKFTEKGEVFFSVKKLNSSFNRKNICDIEFIVKDTGIGISEGDMKNLFIPFHQLNKTGTNGEPGTGLGLSIAQQLVKAMGGEILVQSTFNEGTEMRFVISANFNGQVSMLKNLKNKTMELPKKIFNSNITPTILVVDDNSTNQLTIKLMLKEFGLNCLMASNGQDAVEIMEKNKVELIFMDCQMPIMDGYEATKIIRSKNYPVHIVAMTANASDEDVQKCFNCGMDSFLAKPLTMESLFEELKKFLKKQTGIIDKNIEKILKSKIGEDGLEQIRKVFISEINKLSEDLKNDKFSTSEINKIGHRHSSAAYTVGAVEIGNICKLMEFEQDESKIKELVIDLNRAIEKYSFLQ